MTKVTNTKTAIICNGIRVSSDVGFVLNKFYLCRHSPPATASTPSSPVTSRAPHRSESNNSSSIAGSNASNPQMQLHEYIEVVSTMMGFSNSQKSYSQQPANTQNFA